MTTCVPYAYGVPALSGHPNWWDSSQPEPKFWNKFDDHGDPRWIGSAKKGYEGGSLEQMSFRALHSVVSGQTVLYLAWDIKVDPSVDLDGDAVYLGLQRTGGPPFVIKVVAFSQGADKLEAGKTPDPVVMRGTGLNPPPEGPYDWIAGVNGFGRYWLKNATTTATTNKWSVHLRIPLLTTGDISNSGINLGNVAAGDTFKLWFQVDVDGPGTTVPYNWPRGVMITTVSLQDSYPDPGIWGEFKTSSDPNCATGISLSAWDVGTGNPSPNEILFENPPGPGAPVNQMHARPKNWNTGAGVNANGMQAVFRIANWGTQPDWNAVTNPTQTLWREILPTQVKQNAAAISAATAGANPGDPVTPSQGSIDFNWTLDANEAAEFGGPGATRRPHQCMLVQLSGGGLEFQNDSVYRNMDFKSASETAPDAEVSVVGLQALAASTHRDVFLFVDARGMPEDVKGAGSSPVPGGGVSGGGVEEGGGISGEYRTYLAQGKQPSSFDEAAGLVPTYVVHAFHDSGLRRRKGGRTLKVLLPQTSFGYFIQHSGDLYGWDHALSGPGVRKIARNFYRLPVPNNGSVTIKTLIRALERPRPWWWPFWRLLRDLWERIIFAIRARIG